MKNLTPKQIKQARINAGFHQKNIAELLGVSINTVSGWELGRHTIRPTTLILFKIVTAEDPNKELARHINACLKEDS
jgi:DNA-binding transcriptional regulator YiaG